MYYCANYITYRLGLAGMILLICLMLVSKGSVASNISHKLLTSTNKIQADSTRFNITGQVIDDTGQPLPGATVFISNSKWAASTDNQGVFKITGVPAGNYEILVRMMGFITVTKIFAITDRSVTVNITLKTDAIALNEVKISAKPDANRARYLRLFTQNFIGETDNAKKSKIINSDVIRFTFNKQSGTLNARATDLIKIENTALGYNVNFLLNSFSVNPQYFTFQYDGKVFFEELKGDEKQQRTWTRNRLAAYRGSMRHFLKALYDGTTKSDGFELYKIFDSELRQYGSFRRPNASATNLKPVNPDSLLVRIDASKKLLKIPVEIKDGDTSRLYICYTRNDEPWRFYNSGGHLNLPVPNAQISSLQQIIPGDILLTSDGSLTPEKGLITEGYWAWQRVSELLPYETFSSPQINNAQTKSANPANEKGTVEKIHMQTDRPWYLTGDTAWLKVYVTNLQNKPAINGKTCFVELIDASKSIIKSLRLPLQNGMASGDMALSKGLVKKGYYVLRVYTNTTLKNGNSFFYKTIRIADLSTSEKTTAATALKKQLTLAVDSLNLEFFPEGGALTTNINSRVAVTASAFKHPVKKLSGYVTDNTGNHVAQFETDDSGVGAFNLKPGNQANYWAVVALPNGGEKRFAVPKAQQSGYGMAVRQDDDEVIVKINAGNITGKANLTLVIKINNSVQFQVEKLVPSAGDSIIIAKTDLPAGLLQISLFKADKTLIAERLFYSADKKQQLNVKVLAGKTAYHPHEKVDINLTVIDAENNPVRGNFSVTINNEADVVDKGNNGNILSNLLFNIDDSEVTRKLEAYDLTTSDATQQQRLADFLLTLKSQQTKGKFIASSLQHPVDDEVGTPAVKGSVFTANGKPSAASQVNLFFVSGGPVLSDSSDANGRFRIKTDSATRGDYFYVNGKNNTQKIVIDKYVPPVVGDEFMADTTETYIHDFTDDVLKRLGELKQNNILGIELKEVTIKDKKVAEPTVKDLVLQKSTNLAGRADQVLTFIDLLPCLGNSLLQCLPGRLLGVRAIGDSLYGRSSGDRPITVFIDGVERGGLLAIFPTADIAAVEYISGPAAAIYGNRGANGVIVITTKDGSIDYGAYEQEHHVPGSTKPPPLQRYKYEDGWDIAREFYAPDYTKISANIMDKWRPTIYWNPNFTTGTDGKAQLSYFTNNAPGTYRITIEGLDDKGRIARQVFKYTVSE